MARKKSEGKPVVQATEVTAKAVKAVRLDLDAETHKKLRVEAANRDMSMAELVRQWVCEHLGVKGS